MNRPDQLHISWDQNPSVREAIQNLQPGDKCVIELHLVLDANNPDSADFTIQAAVPEGYELDDSSDQGSSPGTIPSDTTPVGMVIKMKAKASQANKSKVPPPQPARVSVPPTL